MALTQNGSNRGSAATRAVALVGPAGTGKTSLAEALLYASGTINRQGTVEAGNTVGDASAEARARGSSTELNLLHFEYLGDRFALIDVPGGAGFAAGYGRADPVAAGAPATARATAVIGSANRPDRLSGQGGGEAYRGQQGEAV